MKIKNWMALLLMALAMDAGRASAQTVGWHLPFLAELGQSGDPDSTFPFVAETFSVDMPTPSMRSSAAGEHGFVLSGAAQVEPYPWNAETAPYVVKVASRDGRTLWRWQDAGGVDVRGRIRRIAIDAAGDVIGVGGEYAESTSMGLLVIKLDGATGALRWRVVGPAGTAGYDVAVDAHNDVFITGRLPGGGPTGQVVSRYDGQTGALAWSKTLPSGEAAWDDFRIAVDSNGTVVAGGYFDEYVPSIVHGIQLAKLAGENGGMLWSRRLVTSSQAFGAGRLISLHLAPGGDVVVYGYGSADTDPLSLYRLDATNGDTRWHQPQGDFLMSDLLVDDFDRMFVVGAVEPSDASKTAEVHRVDPATGTILWQVDYPAAATYSAGKILRAGADGNLLMGSVYGDQTVQTMRVTNIDSETGNAVWHVVFGSPNSIENGLEDIERASDGSVFVGANTVDASSDQTWTLYKLTGPFADDLFANGYER